MENLPEEILAYIHKFVYPVQNKELLREIRNPFLWKKPKEHQPRGSCNFSRIDNDTLGYKTELHKYNFFKR